MTITTQSLTFSIGELANFSGLSVHTLRWYETQGLFPRDIPRSSSGRRVFNQDAVRWLSFLSRLRESGMPVSVMSRYAELEACRTVIRSKIGSYRQYLGEKNVVGA